MINKDNRDLSGFGISVGTGIALETIFNATDSIYDDKRVFEKEDIRNYSTLVISWYTIIRNVISSLSLKDKTLVFESNHSKELIDIANEEISIINSLCEDIGLSLLILAPYYDKDKHFFFADLSKHTQKNLMFNIAYKSIEDIKFENVCNDYHFKLKGNLLILTHITMDLLNYYSNKLKLLESNTGKIVEPMNFNKKYRKSVNDHGMLPLTYELLYFLGDSSGLLISTPPNYKKHILEIVHGRKIYPKMRHNVVRNILIKDSYASGFITNLHTKY